MNKRARILRVVGWTLAVILLAVVVVANVAAVRFGETIDSYLNSDRVDATPARIETQKAASTALAETIEGEGVVLLENKGGTLPLDGAVDRVNVFGWGSTQWVTGGSGSGGVSGDTSGILDALAARGISYNEDLAKMYRGFQDSRPFLSAGSLKTLDTDFCQLYEPSIDDDRYYSDNLLQQARDYSDTAIVVLSRICGESIDCPRAQYRINERGGKPKVTLGHHYLEPTPEEEDLISYVASTYDKVIVLVNSTNPMELGIVRRIQGVDACMLAGTTGTSAATGVVDALWGTVNPSGRTADTYPYAFETDASWANSGRDGEGSYTDGAGCYPADGTIDPNVGGLTPYDAVRYVDYVEGIYVGYRWFETADAEGYWADRNNGFGSGYAGVVQYPFGYGLSYTSFDWEVAERNFRPRSAVAEGETLELKVKVTNTGEVAGKDVVQLYFAPPYTKGGIEKSSTVLADFAKTDLLQPGESQEVALSVPVRSMASYDCYDANHDGLTGWELEAGAYELQLKRDAHNLADCDDAVTPFRVDEDIHFATDPVTGSQVKNRFTGAAAEGGVSIDGRTTGAGITYLTRADFKGTFPSNRAADREMDDAIKILNIYDADLAAAADSAADKSATVAEATAGAPAHDVALGASALASGAQVPPAATDRDASSSDTSSEGNASSGDSSGKHVEKVCQAGKITPLGRALGSNYNDVRWISLLDSLTPLEMKRIVLHGYTSSAAIESIGKPRTKDLDGPAQVSSFNQIVCGIGYPNPTTIAQTWNRSLAHEFGRACGMECAMLGIDGWYAPGVNLHRSPLGGRNYEFYSEDPLLSGVFGAETISGSNETGTFCYLKHLICNEMDSYRDSLYTWLTEQTLRELYLEPFRIAVEHGGCSGIMSSYNRLGAVWSGGSHALLTTVLRGEWGFHGSVITDYSDHHKYMNADQMIRAGGSIFMDGVFADGNFAFDTSSKNFDLQLRRATKDIIYIWLNARAKNLAYNETAQAAGLPTLDRPIKTHGTSAVIVAVSLIDAVVLMAVLLHVVHRVRKRKELGLK